MIALAIFLGGGVGSLLRYLTGKVVNEMAITSFPLGTLISNILASLILVLVLFQWRENIKPDGFLFYFLVIGLCGGFSTFSTFTMETVALAQASYWGWVALNIFVSIGVCFSLIWFLSKT